MNQIVMLEERGPVHAGELRALVRVYQHLFLRLASPHGHKQSLENDIGGLAALHRPTDHTTRIEVDDNGEIGEALAGSNVGDVRHPGSVWSRHVELPVERIIDDDRRSATIDAGTAFVADLRLDPGEMRQTRNPVWVAYLALIEKIVVQLAIAVDLAAFFPCLQEQLGLSLVLVGSPTQRVLQPGVKSTRVNSQETAHRPH